MKISIKIKTVFLSILAVILIIITVMILGTARFNTPNEFRLVQLNSGWTISRGEESYLIESLVDSSTGLANKGDNISISTIVPQVENVRIPICICFRSILSTVDVYLDGKLIYSFGHDYVEKGKMVPKLYNFVPLPKDCSDKLLTIRFTAQEDNAFSGFSTIYMGTYKDVSNALVQPNRLSLVIGDFLILFGFILFILSPFLLFSTGHDASIFFSAAISFMMGIYILCFNDLFWLISDNTSLNTFFEYFSLFSIPASIIGFILFANKGRNKQIVTYAFLANLLFIVTVTLLHVFNIAHINSFVTFFHITVFIEGIYLIVSLTKFLIKRLRSKGELQVVTKSFVLLVLGLILFMLCSMIDILKFNFMKYSSTGEQTATINFTTVGALLFMVCLFLNYFFQRIEYFSEMTVKEKLEGIAYTDALTGISNRAKCELTLASLKENYTIISLDLDYLKYTNDNYGHAEGDKLLLGFANILKESFTDAMLIGRMGGDEFIVILPFINDDRCQRDLKCLMDLMCYRTSKEDHIRYSASWGYATSDDSVFNSNVTALDVYLMADTRMYSMKKEHHNQSLGRLYDDLVKNLIPGGNADED